MVEYGWDQTPTPDLGLDITKAPADIQKLYKWVIEKTYGEDVASAYGQGLIAAGIIAKNAEAMSLFTSGQMDALDTFVKETLIELTDKDVISAPEIIMARNGESTLADRLDRDLAATSSTLAEYNDNIRNDLVRSTENLLVFKDDNTVDILNRATNVYTVTRSSGVTKIQSTNYAVGSDFAMVTYENIAPGESTILRLKGKLVSSRTIIVRFGYSGTSTYISPFNGSYEVVIPNPPSGRPVNFLYFDFMGNATMELESVELVRDSTASLNSFYEVDNAAKPYELISTSSGTIEQMLSVATTYLKNIEQLTYGNSYTMFDATSDKINDKYQIDCSSFFSAIFKGITFENSRYINPTNKDSRWGFLSYDATQYRLANQLAKLANSRGYGFVPREDLSDLRPGDVLFFSWDSEGGDIAFKNRAWMGIQHVAIYLDKEDTDKYVTLQLDNGFSNVIYMPGDEYMSQCVYAARFPTANLESSFDRTNLISDGAGEYSNNSGLNCKLSEPLTQYNVYTLVVDYELLTPGKRLVIQNGDWATIIAHTQATSLGRRKSVYRFIYNFQNPSSTLKVSISGAGEGRANFFGQTLYKGFPIFD